MFTYTNAQNTIDNIAMVTAAIARANKLLDELKGE